MVNELKYLELNGTKASTSAPTLERNNNESALVHRQARCTRRRHLCSNSGCKHSSGRMWDLREPSLRSLSQPATWHYAFGSLESDEGGNRSKDLPVTLLVLPVLHFSSHTRAAPPIVIHLAFLRIIFRWLFTVGAAREYHTASL